MKRQYVSLSTLKKIPFILFSIFLSKTSVSQNPGCHAGFTFVVSGNTITFNDTSFFDVGPQNTTWFWDFGDGSTDISQNPSHTFNTPPDQFTICLAVSNCAILPGTCCTDTVCHTIQLGDPTGVLLTSLTGDNPLVSPNPFSENFTLNFYLQSAGTITVQITDAAGRACYVSEALTLPKGYQSLNLKENILASKGIYVLQVVTNGKPMVASKLIKL